jgi:hypothetical protein
MSPEEAQ